MKRLFAFLGAALVFTLAGSAPAQQFSQSMGSTMAGPFSTTGNTSSFLSSTMTRPSMAAMSFRTPTPTPLNFNISSFLPSFPQLQNTLLMRNIFGGTQTRVIPRQVTPPPKKK